MNSSLSKVVNLRLGALTLALTEPMSRIAALCGEALDQPSRLNTALTSGLATFDSCSLIYVVNPYGIQVSANVSSEGAEASYIGQDLSNREWFQSAKQGSESLYLSDVYLSDPGQVIGITAVHRIQSSSGFVFGYLCADFKLDRLPVIDDIALDDAPWNHIAEDSSIRNLMFHQRRHESNMEKRFNQLKPILHALIQSRGVFQVELQFSDDRILIWQADDPMVYEVLTLDQLLDPSIGATYRWQPPLQQSQVDDVQLDNVLELFHALRVRDGYLYVRTAFINVINGRVGLKMSWDVQHDLTVKDFVATNPARWIGESDLHQPEPLQLVKV